jgi:hypothetical protein
MNISPNPEFDALVSGLREEMRDPVVTDLIKHVHELEEALNSDDGRLSEADKGEAVFAINSLLETWGLLDAEIIVSGKLRLDISDFDARDDMTIAQWGMLYGELLEDSEGPYLYVDHKTLVSRTFDIVSESTISAYGPDRQIHRLLLSMTTTIDEDDTTSVYVYLDELDDFTPKDPSLARIIREIRDNYPEIAEQLDQLPEDCGDDKQIIAALSDFVLEIDWSRHSSLTEDEQNELIDFIEHYIGHRLQFDISEYQLEICGPYYKKGYKGNLLRQSAEMPIEKRGKIFGVSLGVLNSPIESSEVTAYVPEIKLWASVARRGGGNEYITVPLYSIENIQNFRNGIEDAESAGHEYEPDDIDYDETEWPDSKDEDTDEAHGEDMISEVSIRESVEQREQKLDSLQEKLIQLVEVCRMIGDIRYTDDDTDELDAAQASLAEYLIAFMDIYKDVSTAIEVSGPGVSSVPGAVEVSFDEEDESIDVNIRSTTIEEGDLLSFKKGVITGMSTAVEINEDESRSLRIYLRLRDLQTHQPINITTNALKDFSFVEAHIIKNFAARIEKGDTTITIPERDRIVSIKRQIDQISHRFEDRSELPVVLTTLYEFMEMASPHGYIDFPDIKVINEIGKLVGGDDTLRDKVSTAITDIMLESQIKLVGDAYDERGMLTERIKLDGRVVDVVPEISYIPEDEPMIKIEDTNLGIYYVPLSKIESMRI